MPTELIAVSFFSIVISFFCSLSEAALYAIPLPVVKHLAQKGIPAAKKLEILKKDVGKLITAMLILNTLANTAGAAIAGAQAGVIWGEKGVIIFSVFFTISVLLFGEILPKTLGVAHSKSIALAIAPIWTFLVWLFGPLATLGQSLTVRLSSKNPVPTISQEELISMAQLGTEEGTLDRFEGGVISNVMALDNKLVRDVLTPRVSVFMLPENSTVLEIREQIFKWKFSRVPIYSIKDPDHLTGYVIHRDIIKVLLSGETKTTLKSLSRPIKVLPELTTVDKILRQMFENKEHICALVDEHGGLAGIVTLEDLLEEILGHEIVDEKEPR